MKKLQYVWTVLSVLSMAMGYSQTLEEIDGKALFGDLTARHIGPALMSGRINDMETHPTNSRIVYAGTAGGGVWKSSDGGTTFNPIFDDYCQSIGAVALDPNDPDNTIYVGTGETWTRNSVSIVQTFVLLINIFYSHSGGQKLLNTEHTKNIWSARSVKWDGISLSKIW